MNIPCTAFYVNITLNGPRREAVVAAVGGEAFVAAGREGCVVVLDAAGGGQDLGQVEALAGRLSGERGCPALAALVHDGDVFLQRLCLDGELRRLSRWNL